MNTFEAIAGRRSIRRFEDRAVPRELVERILSAAVQAPSAKNTQPWRFVVLEGERKQELVTIMQRQHRRLEDHGIDTGSLKWTARSMAAAPITILVLHERPPAEIPPQAHDDYASVMLQSTGGAIQTMLLAAHELGLGSLWIADVLYADGDILRWLGREDHALIAAVALGYAAESPAPRPRRPWPEVTEWRD